VLEKLALKTLIPPKLAKIGARIVVTFCLTTACKSIKEILTCLFWASAAFVKGIVRDFAVFKGD
jgi:hypothetical protein